MWIIFAVWGVRLQREDLSIPLKPAKGIRIVACDRRQLIARSHLRAVAAGLNRSAHRAFADGTDGVTVRRLGPRDPAAGAVDHIGRYLNAVQL